MYDAKKFPYKMIFIVVAYKLRA